MSQHVTPGDGDDPSLAALVTQWRGQDGSIQPVAVGGHGEGGAAAPLNLDPNAKSGGGSNVSCLAWMCTLCVYKLCCVPWIRKWWAPGHPGSVSTPWPTRNHEAALDPHTADIDQSVTRPLASLLPLCLLG